MRCQEGDRPLYFLADINTVMVLSYTKKVTRSSSKGNPAWKLSKPKLGGLRTETGNSKGGLQPTIVPIYHRRLG